jgi:hypothetical protein
MKSYLFDLGSYVRIYLVMSLITMIPHMVYAANITVEISNAFDDVNYGILGNNIVLRDHQDANNIYIDGGGIWDTTTSRPVPEFSAMQKIRE